MLPAALAVVLVGLVGTAAAVTVPLTDPTYIQSTDMTTFNWRILEAFSGGAITVPALPTGNNVAPFVRIFSNGNTNQPVAALTEPVKWQGGQVTYAPGVDTFNLPQSSRFWYGLEFNQQGQPDVNETIKKYLTTDAMLAQIQMIDPGSVTPVFAYDQNQVRSQTPYPLGDAAKNNDPVLPADWGTAPAGSVLPAGTVTPSLPQDIWIKFRVILLDPAAVLGGLPALIGMNATGLNGLVDPLIAANDPKVDVFVLADDDFLDFPDFLDPGSPDWAFLPGELTMEDPNNPGTFVTVDNNGEAATGDWGGFFPGMDLTKYPGWAMFMEIQTFLDDDGQEEVYVVGGVGSPPDVIPEPLTVLGALLGVGACGGYFRKRLA